MSSESTVAILTYHSLDNSGSVISTSPEKFQEQMDDLAHSGATVLSLSELVMALKEKKELPSITVALTFDDGFRNLYDKAFPVLRDNGFPATVFLVTAFCGKNNRWYGQPQSIPELELLGWKEILDMSRAGIEFGVHTATHPDLSHLEAEAMRDEILGAKEVLHRNVRQEKYAFAFPYGKGSRASRKILEEYFYSACSTQMGFVSQESDLYFLPRLDMFYFSGNNIFSSIGSASFKRFVQFRKTLRQLKQTIAGDSFHGH
jgi:peptidoglycan/xylan/chitin deacetylase (PgdA/CDA1 family)